MQISSHRFSKCGDKDNFWAMGETGPCGYCSEIYYDYGEQFDGDAPGDDANEGERYVEIWNLVFMEFVRDKDGKLTKLPNPSIDTGMGLERIAAVMQRDITRGDNYEIDVFHKLIKEAFSSVDLHDVFSQYLKSGQIIADNDQVRIIDPKIRLAMRVVCDHARGAAFLVADGILPSNEGRGYILRKIIRRAVRFLYLLGFRRSLLWRFALFWSMPNLMGKEYFYPELIAAAVGGENGEKSQTALVVKNEETQFINTLERGIDKFSAIIDELHDASVLPGKQVFYLYDTFGFPLEVTKEMAREKNLSVDEDGFACELEKQRQLSREASKFAVPDLKLEVDSVSQFVGYSKTECDSVIAALYKVDGTKTDTLVAGEEGIVVLAVTPFYAESGGQVGDSGEIYSHNGDNGVFLVADTQKYSTVHLHYGKIIKGALVLQQNVHTAINEERRQAIKLNHSAAHLLHRAIRMVVGQHATQRGSYVDDKRLRFDIAHFSALTAEEIKEIEQIVNQEIRHNLLVTTEEKSLQQAREEEVMALFDEKYGEVVRVVKMGDFSAELCGGTHVANTGDIGIFKIILETSIAAGVRRIEALTGENARLWYEEHIAKHNAILHLLKSDEKQVLTKVQQLLTDNVALEKEIKKLQTKILTSTSQSDDFKRDISEVNGIKILIREMANTDAKTLRQVIDEFKQKLKSAVILLATIQNDKAQLIAGVTQDCLSKITANEIIRHIVPGLDGSGGGRADMAQGGGSKITVLSESLREIRVWIEKKLK